MLFFNFLETLRMFTLVIKKMFKNKLEVFSLKNLPDNNFFNMIIIFVICSTTYLTFLIISKDNCLKEILERINLTKILKGKR